MKAACMAMLLSLVVGVGAMAAEPTTKEPLKSILARWRKALEAKGRVKWE